MNKLVVFGLGVGAGIALTCLYGAYKKSMNKSSAVVEKGGGKPIEGTLQTPSKKEEEKK